MEESCFSEDDIFGIDALQYNSEGTVKAIPMLATLIDAHIKRNDADANSLTDTAPDSDLVLAFRGGPAATGLRPEMPLCELLETIQILQAYSPSCYVLAGIYLDRFLSSRQAKEAGFVLDSSTVHRLVAAALLIAAKLAHRRDDKSIPLNQYFECISAKELNDLELKFLRAVDYRLYVTPDKFRRFCAILRLTEASSNRKRKARAGAGGRQARRRVTGIAVSPVR